MAAPMPDMTGQTEQSETQPSEMAGTPDLNTQVAPMPEGEVATEQPAQTEQPAAPEKDKKSTIFFIVLLFIVIVAFIVALPFVWSQLQ